MTSVERVLDYTNVEQEPELESAAGKKKITAHYFYSLRETWSSFISLNHISVSETGKRFRHRIHEYSSLNKIQLQDWISLITRVRMTYRPITIMYTSYSSSIGATTLSWVSACSTVVEHSQQEGFTECRCQRHVKPPTLRRTRDLERSNFRHKRPPASEGTLANPAAEGGTMGEKWPREFFRKWRLPRHFRALLMP
jgi:hypothetical protein